MTANNENQEEKKVAQPVAAAPVDLATFDWDAYENDLGVYDDTKEHIEAEYDQTPHGVDGRLKVATAELLISIWPLACSVGAANVIGTRE